MERELTNRQRGLLTLLLEKMNWHGQMMGATENRNWVTQAYYDFSPGSEKPQGTLDRIGKVTYQQTFHTTEDSDFLKWERLGPDLFDHLIQCEWRELFGKGWGPNPPECMLKPYCSLLKDAVGNWHSQNDTGFSVVLWHPSKQGGGPCSGQERVHGRWLTSRGVQNPHWRPLYHYTRDEVIEALKIMADEFGWGFEEGRSSEWMST